MYIKNRIIGIFEIRLVFGREIYARELNGKFYQQY